MARRRFYRDTGPVKRTRVNDMIRISPLRVIGPENEQIGIIEREEALRMADDAGLDLVEIQPDTRPPVCKIMDFGKFKYETSKKQSKSKASSQVSELKEVRLGRSIKVDPHDIGIRIQRARRFLMDGHKVQLVQMYRGREVVHRNLGLDIMQRVVNELADVSKIEIPPKHVDRRTLLMLAPDKAKIEKIKAQKAREERQRLADKGPQAQEPEPEDLIDDENEDFIDGPDTGDDDDFDERPEDSEGSDAAEEKDELVEELGFEFEPEGAANRRRGRR